MWNAVAEGWLEFSFWYLPNHWRRDRDEEKKNDRKEGGSPDNSTTTFTEKESCTKQNNSQK
jgi:hypothetical protein